MSDDLLVLDPLLGTDGADAVVRLWHDFGSYGQYSNEGFDTRFAPDLPQRYDARENFVRTGGRFRRDVEDPGLLGARTNYFRETYAYGDETFSDDPAVGALMHHDGLLDAARKIHGRDVVVPAILYANILMPGQELAVHTDVPEFRGADRKHLPQWLLVVMHHSGLFERWRLPIATGIAWFHDSEHGALAYWPDGPAAPKDEHRIRANTALVLDTDTVFHGVDRVTSDAASVVPPVAPDSTLAPAGGVGEPWVLRSAADEEVARYDWDELRFSVSWTAYVFADEAEREAWRTGSDDLDEDAIVDRLVADLVERGLAAPDVPRDPDLGLLLIDTYVGFPD
jgi:hypothetical protein